MLVARQLPSTAGAYQIRVLTNKNDSCARKQLLYKSCKEMGFGSLKICKSPTSSELSKILGISKYVCRDQMPSIEAPSRTIGSRWKVSHVSVSTCE